MGVEQNELVWVGDLVNGGVESQLCGLVKIKEGNALCTYRVFPASCSERQTSSRNW